MFALGVVHVVFGLIRYKVPVAAAISAGFIGKFAEPEIRRTAFWFLICGPLLMLAGHVAIYAVADRNLALLKIVGTYSLVVAVIGVMAFPKSPFLAALVISPLVIAAGYDLLP